MATAATELPALARDRQFESLYRRYVDDVYRYALAMLRNPADAEDVTQTTFLNAYRAVKRGEEIEKPQNWLITIAHNAARSRYARASRRVDEVPLEDHLEQLAVPEVERPQVQGVIDALGRLPLNQRAALVMRELEGRTYAEIADTLGVSVSAVETLIFRARRSLRVKASDLRVLSLVPAPGWLWKLLDLRGLAGGGAAAGSGAVIGGGAAAGGGAATGAGTMMGSGFLLKAAVAVVAGVLASGVGSDSPRPADAARSPLPYAASVANGGKPVWISALGGDARPTVEAVPGVAGSTAAGGRFPDGGASAVAGDQFGGLPQPITDGTLVLGGAAVTGPGAVASQSAQQAAAAAPSSGPAGSPASPASSAPTPTQVVSTAVTTVTTVTNAAPRPAVPSAPVSVPVPSAPVPVPSAPVQVPSSPVRVPSPPVQLPPPPAQLPPPPVQLPPPPVPLPLP